MYDIKPLWGPNGLNSCQSEGLGINAAGDVAGRYNCGGSAGGTIWVAASLTLQLPDDVLLSINNNQQAVGNHQPAGKSTPDHAIFVQKMAVKDLSSKVGPGSTVAGINDSGLICGSVDGNLKSFIYDSMKGIVSTYIPPFSSDQYCSTEAINEKGDVVGMSQSINASTAFHYDHSTGKYTKLNAEPSPFAPVPFDINEHSQIVGCFTELIEGGDQPFIWFVTPTQSTQQQLKVPPGYSGGCAFGINNAGVAHGTVVGGCWTPKGNWDHSSAFLYDPDWGGSIDLNSLIPPNSGWHLERAASINDTGQITGLGTLNGIKTGFLLTPAIPGPPTKSLLIALHEILANTHLSPGVLVDGGGWAEPGGPIDPWGPFWQKLSASKQDALLRLALDKIALHTANHAARQSIRLSSPESLRLSINQVMGSSRPSKAGVSLRRDSTSLQRGKLISRLSRFRGAESRM